MKINELKPYMKKIELKFKVIELTEVRTVKSMLDKTEHNVCEAKISDETGSVYLTLWDKTIQEIQVGKTYLLENGFTSEFKKSLRVNIGRFGKLTEINEDIQTNTENMLSTPVELKPKPVNNDENQTIAKNESIEENKETNKDNKEDESIEDNV